METSVVISGGGPTGMWLACELQLAGVPTVVLDETLEINPNSRALTIHPRTIETFALRGAHEQLLSEGGQLPSGHFAVLDDRLDFRTLDTDFPFTLTIPQARTTALLQERSIDLGADVRRGHRFTGVSERGDSVLVSVDGPDGSYTIEAEYLVGCDGTRSSVRKSAGIEFDGTSATALGALGDVTLADPPATPVISKWSLDGTFMCVELPNGQHRIAVHSPEDLRTDWPGDFTLEELRGRIKRIAGTDYGMHSPSWLSRYGNTSRIARNYRKGRILLAGDAAHQHMPAGGVGLNVGVQDAMNLGWKLAATVNGWAAPGLLDTYHDERHPVGLALLEQSQAQTALFMDFTIQGEALRSFVSRMIAERPQFAAALTERLSGLNVEYPSAGSTVLAGKRAPNLELSQDTALFALLADGKYAMIDFALAADFDVRDLDFGDFDGHVNRHRVSQSSVQSREAWAGVSAALIRPDGYVAWASTERVGPALLAEVEHAVDNVHSNLQSV